MKNILVVVESINIEDSSGTKGRVALIQNLHDIGYNLKVLHYTRKNINLEGITCISITERKFSLNYVLSRTQRLVQRWFKIDFSVFLENIFGNSFTFFNDSKSITKAVQQYYENEDLIITLSKGASFRPHHAMLALPKLHNKWLAYVHDPFPFHFYPRPYNFVEKGYRFKESFFRAVSEKAQLSTFPSLLLKEWMGSYFPNLLKTGIIIPHQILATKIENKTKIPDYLDVSKFNILHAGNLLAQRSPMGLISGYKLFLERNPDAINFSRLLFLGKASNHSEKLLNETNENIYWSQGNVPFEEVNYVQNNVTVNVILESKSEISPFLPGKFPHCVSANKPILLLGPHYSESKRLLGDNYRYACEVDEVEKIAEKLEELYKLWEENRGDFYLNRPDLENYLSKENLKQIIELNYFS